MSVAFRAPVLKVTARGDAMTTLLASSVDDEWTSVNEDTVHTTGYNLRYSFNRALALRVTSKFIKQSCS